MTSPMTQAVSDDRRTLKPVPEGIPLTSVEWDMLSHGDMLGSALGKKVAELLALRSATPQPSASIDHHAYRVAHLPEPSPASREAETGVQRYSHEIDWARPSYDIIPDPNGDWVKYADLALASPRETEGREITEETGWLIELKGNTPLWWSLGDMPDGDEPDWNRDSLKALRFARKIDADAYINDQGWTEAFASEHMWQDRRALNKGGE